MNTYCHIPIKKTTKIKQTQEEMSGIKRRMSDYPHEQSERKIKINPEEVDELAGKVDKIAQMLSLVSLFIAELSTQKSA